MLYFFVVHRADGTWSGAWFSCINRQVTCPPFSSTNGVIDNKGCGNFAGCPGLLTCNPGFPLIGPLPYSVCQTDGTWLAPVPSCTPPVRYCGDQNPPVNGQATGTCVQATNGQVCSYSCNPGFVLQGVQSITCTNGLWSG